MTSKSILSICTLSALALGFISCGDEAPAEEAILTEDTTIAETTNSKAISVDGRVFSVPSPAQTAIMLKSLGKGYNKDLAVANTAVDRATSKSDKALLMGMYGADLAYAVAFQDGQSALSKFKVVQQVALDLGVENAIDRALVERFMGNMENDDSLLVLSGVAFQAADQYLKENDRNDVSSLVLAGGWVETMFVALSVHNAEPDDMLAARIAEQRLALDNLVEVMRSSQGNEKVATLLADLTELKVLFAKVPSTYKFVQPKTDVENKTTYINSKTEVSLGGELLKAITDKVAAMREGILS